MNDERRHDEELDARRLDWALREVVGSEHAPDVVAAVLARAAAGDRGDAGEVEVAMAAPSRLRWLLLAAMFLLGVFTVFAVAWSRRAGDGAAPVDEAQGPGVGSHVLITRADFIPSLAKDTQAVELRNLDDAAVAALVKQCPDLRHLILWTNPVDVRSGAPGNEVVSITDESFPAIGSLTRLRRLEIVGARRVKGARLRELERLPLLEHLTLSWFDLGDESMQTLPRLPSLRELDLECNQGFGERGVAAIGGCVGLRVLSLNRAAPLRDEWFAPLARLTSLQSLKLEATGLNQRLLSDRGFAGLPASALAERSIGVTALQPWPALRTLSLAYALHLEPSAGAQLARECPALETLVLDRCLAIDDTTVANVLALRFLRSLSLRECPKVTETSLPLLVQARQLREVHFGTAPWLTLAQAEQLMASGKRVICGRPDDPTFERALAALQQRHAASVAGERPALVRSLAEIAALPADTMRVELRNLDDAAVAALVARCPDLEHLVVFASTATARPGSLGDQAVSITDAALPMIGSLGRLRRLELVGVQHVKGTQLRELERLPLLEDLTLSFFDLDDDSLQVLPRLPSLRALDLEGNQGYGERGLAAIGTCPGLRSLSLSGSAPLRDESFKPLERLTSLQSLNLKATGMARRLLFAKGFPEPRTPKFGDRSISVAALQRWPALRTVSLANALHIEPSVGATLVRLCPALQTVVLDVCLAIDDTTVADLLALRFLSSLSLRDCPKVTATSLPLLVQARQLREVHFGKTPWLSLAYVEQLLDSGKRVTCERPDDPAFERALAALQQRYSTTVAQDRSELVRSLAEIEALPADTTRVECRGLGDRAAELLSRRAELRHVAFVRDDDDPFTDKALAMLAKLPKLESLELSNLPRVSTYAIQAVRAIRSLRELDVVGVAVGDVALRAIADLPALTTLKLRGVRTFGEDGMRALGKCRSLRAVDLSKCEQLSPAAIAQLGTLLELESLQLADLPRLNDSALMGLEHLTKLRTLDIARGPFTSTGMQVLAGMRELRALTMSGNGEVVPSVLASLPVGVEELELDDCKGLDAAAAAVLRDRFPGLSVLGIAGSAWLDDDCLATILQSASLERLGIRDCGKLTVRSLDAIRNAKALRDLDATRVPFFTDEVAAELVRQRPELRLKYRIW